MMGGQEASLDASTVAGSVTGVDVSGFAVDEEVTFQHRRSLATMAASSPFRASDAATPPQLPFGAPGLNHVFGAGSGGSKRVQPDASPRGTSRPRTRMGGR
jgi:hypothetical protein